MTQNRSSYVAWWLEEAIALGERHRDLSLVAFARYRLGRLGTNSEENFQAVASIGGELRQAGEDLQGLLFQFIGNLALGRLLDHTRFLRSALRNAAEMGNASLQAQAEIALGMSYSGHRRLGRAAAHYAIALRHLRNSRESLAAELRQDAEARRAEVREQMGAERCSARS